ncbi:MAG: YCF48-related protein [Rhodocyclaceae bacterium]|nr:YCF48-related protein [Rhodocyclaceae bacterium]
MRKPAYGALALVVAAAVAAPAISSSFKDPLDVSAIKVSRVALTTQMSGIARAGNHLVAVGVRGLILVSEDDGNSWQQASVPVSSDLLGVNFPTDKDGWAVGHDGVVLHTADGGLSWERQLDGRQAQKLLTDHFQALMDRGNPDAQRFLQDVKINYADGPEQALLGVWFKDAKNGFVCGSFGTLLATRDGGKTWESWVEKVDAPMPVHYNAILGTKKGGVYIASEKGVIFQLDQKGQRFIPVETGYAGTFFSLVEAGDAVLALGLRGTAYRMATAQGSGWAKVDTGVGSAFTGSVTLANGEALVVTQTGQALSTSDSGSRFRTVPVSKPMLFTGVALARGNEAVAVGTAGVRRIQLN